MNSKQQLFPSLDDDETMPQPPLKDATYAHLVQTATELYARQGYQNTALDQILEYAELKPSDFQAHFLDSEDLFCAVYSHAFEEVRATVVSALLNQNGGMEAMVRRCLSALYRHLKNHTLAARILFHEALQAGPRADTLYHQTTADLSLMLDLVISGLYEAELPDDEYQQKWIIQGLLGSVIYTAHLWVLEDCQTPEETLVQNTYALFKAFIRQWLDILRLDKKVIAARQPDKNEHYVSMGYILPLLDYLRERHLPLDAILATLGLDDPKLAHHTLMIAASREQAAFALASTLSQDPHLGFHVGQRLRVSCLGIVGHLLMTCASIEEALVILKRFGLLIRNIGQLSYHREGEQLYLTLSHPDGNPDRQRIERLLAGLIVLGRELAGHHFHPNAIDFPFAAPTESHEQAQFFRCPLRYNAPELRCYFSVAMLRSPLPSNTTELRQALEAEATRQLHALSGLPTDADPRIAALKSYLADTLKEGVPELNVTAQALNTNPRNLQRLLESRKTNYSEVIDEVRRDMAVRYLKDRRLSLVDIAIELGFGDQSSFNRAFKRWFNNTPSDYRKHLLDNH